MIISLWCENYSLSIEGRDFILDLVSLSMKYMDITLGVIWLIANQVVLDCFNGTMQSSSKSFIPSSVSYKPLITISGLINIVWTELQDIFFFFPLVIQLEMI